MPNASQYPTWAGVVLVVVGVVVLFAWSTVIGVVLIVVGLGAVGFGQSRRGRTTDRPGPG